MRFRGFKGFRWFSPEPLEPLEPSEPPEPFERLLWRGRPLRIAWGRHGERYFLTDLRLVSLAGRELHEIALHDIADVHRTQSRLDRLLGTSTLTVESRHRAAPPLLLTGVRAGTQLAALLELLAGDPRASLDDEMVRIALAWDPRPPGGDLREALGGLAALSIAIVAVVFGLHGHATPIAYAPDDAIVPGGVKKPQRSEERR